MSWQEKLLKYPGPERVYSFIAFAFLVYGIKYIPPTIAKNDILYQAFPLIISASLSIFFFTLGRNKGTDDQDEIDPGFFWLAIAMLAWEFMAILHLHGYSNHVTILGKFLLNIANSIALLAAIKHLNLLEEGTTWYYKWTRWFQQLSLFRRDSVLLGIVILLFIGVLLVANFWPEDKVLSDGQIQLLRAIQLALNLFVSIFLPVAIYVLFKEREIEKLNWIVFSSFLLVLYYEIVEFLGTFFISGLSDQLPELLKPESVNFLYKIYLFIIFFSLSVSYRVYQKKKEILEVLRNPMYSFIDFFRRKKEEYAKRSGDDLYQILHFDYHTEQPEINIDGQVTTPTAEKLNCASATIETLLGGNVAGLQIDDQTIHTSFLNEFSKRIVQNKFSLSVVAMVLWAVARRKAPDEEVTSVDQHFLHLSRQFDEGYQYTSEDGGQNDPALLKTGLTQAEVQMDDYHQMLRNLYTAFDQTLASKKTSRYLLRHTETEIQWVNEKPRLVIQIGANLLPLVNAIHSQKYTANPSKIDGLTTRSFVCLIRGLDNAPVDLENSTEPNGQISFYCNPINKTTQIIFKK